MEILEINRKELITEITWGIVYLLALSGWVYFLLAIGVGLAPDYGVGYVTRRQNTGVFEVIIGGLMAVHEWVTCDVCNSSGNLKQLDRGTFEGSQTAAAEADWLIGPSVDICPDCRAGADIAVCTNPARVKETSCSSKSSHGLAAK